MMSSLSRLCNILLLFIHSALYTVYGNWILNCFRVVILPNVVESSNNFSVANNDELTFSKLKHSVVAEELNISVEDFFNLFIKDDAPFGIEK